MSIIKIPTPTSRRGVKRQIESRWKVFRGSKQEAGKTVTTTDGADYVSGKNGALRHASIEKTALKRMTVKERKRAARDNRRTTLSTYHGEEFTVKS